MYHTKYPTPRPNMPSPITVRLRMISPCRLFRAEKGDQGESPRDAVRNAFSYCGVFTAQRMACTGMTSGGISAGFLTTTFVTVNPHSSSQLRYVESFCGPPWPMVQPRKKAGKK